MVYITMANSKRILRKLDLKNLNLTGAIYSKPIYFLNRNEEQALLAYKEFLLDPQKFVDYIYQKVHVIDSYRYVYEEKAPCYHASSECERLNAEFKNYLIPQFIREKGDDYIDIYREWFKKNVYLLDGDEAIFEMRFYARWGIHFRKDEIVRDNSGIVHTINRDLNTLEEDLDRLIKEAGRFYYQSPKHTRILKQYSRYSFLGHNSGILCSNRTGYKDKEVKELLCDYEERFKKPIINMLYDYYRIKLNPELEMEGRLLEQLGFKPCGHCLS